MHLQEDAKGIFLQTLRVCDIRALIKKRFQLANGNLCIDGEEIFLSDYDGILLIGMGKASIEMGISMEAILGGYIKKGILVTNHWRTKKIKSEVIVAGHPIPNENSMKAALQILEAIRLSSEKTLIICLLSGGGSSLVELPQFGISLEDLQFINQVLIKSGANISEINIIRKYISQTKGGKLGLAMGTRRCLAIYLSDVNADDIDSLASGPLITKVINPEEVIQIIEKYHLLTKIPAAVIDVIQKGSFGAPPGLADLHRNYTHLLLADNRLAVDVASAAAEHRGYQVHTIPDLVEGDYRSIADELIVRLREMSEKFPHDKVGLISGGEVACTVKGQGLGGRNQEFVLYSASKLADFNPNYEVAILSAGTDGIDGISVASGAVMGQHQLDEKGQSLLAENNSYSLIKYFGGLIVLGPTGNNIRDLRVHLAAPKEMFQH